MLAKITETHLAAVGAANVSEFSASLDNFIAEHNRIKTMAESTPDLSAVIKRLDALESRPVFDAAAMTTAINEAIAGSIPAAMTAWAGSEGGKKLIGAEASRIVMEASAGTGTIPAKPAPAPGAAETNEEKVKALQAQGKHEEAFALLPAAKRGEFVNAKEYAAYMRAVGGGIVAVKFSQSTKDFSNRN